MMSKISAWVLRAIVILMITISAIPFYIVFVMATYYTENLYKVIPLLPSNYFFQNLNTVLQANFFRYYMNSVIVSVSAVFIAVFTSSLIGFAISKYNLKYKKVIMVFVMLTMMVPSQLALIGYVMEMRILGLNTGLWPIILCWTASPFGAFFMIQFIKDAVPDEIIECAKLDGCNDPRIYLSIVLPCIKSAISALAILIFLWSWNSYLLPLVSLNNPKFYTIPVHIRMIGNEYRVDYAGSMCALAMSIFPILIVYIIGQKSFVKGLTAGAVKG